MSAEVCIMWKWEKYFIPWNKTSVKIGKLRHFKDSSFYLTNIQHMDCSCIHTEDSSKITNDHVLKGTSLCATHSPMYEVLTF